MAAEETDLPLCLNFVELCFVHQRVGNRKWENSGWSLKTWSDYIALSRQEKIAVAPLHYSCADIQYSTFACVILLK